jgi:hypothetical protein
MALFPLPRGWRSREDVAAFIKNIFTSSVQLKAAVHLLQRRN